MTCPYCDLPIRHIADYGPNQARRCIRCGRLFKGPR